MKPKVLHVCKSLDLGGTPKVCQLLCKGLSQTDEFNIHLLHNKNNSNERYDLFRQFMSQGQILSYDNEQEGEQMIRDFAPNIVHLHRSGFAEWPEPGIHISPDSKIVETNIFGIIDSNPHIDKTLFVSKWLFEHVIPKSHRRHPRFDYLFNPIEEPKTQEKLDIKADCDIIVGRCGRPDNGIYSDINVKAVARLKDKYKILFLVVAPPPQMLKDLQKYGINYQVVEPTVDEIVLNKFYNTIDVLVWARSDGESQGLNLTEAMMAKKPFVVHGDCPFSAHENLAIDSQGGFISRKDPIHYAQLLEKFILNKKLRVQMGLNGYQYVVDNILLTIIIEKLSHIYQEIL